MGMLLGFYNLPTSMWSIHMTDTPYYPASHRRYINSDEEYAAKLKYYGGYKRRCLNCEYPCPQLNCDSLVMLHCPKYPDPTLIQLYTQHTQKDNR